MIPPDFAGDRARMHLLSACADPAQAARYLQRLESLGTSAAARLIESSTGLQSVIALFAASRVLSEEVLRNPEWLLEIIESGDLHRRFSPEDFPRRIEAALPAGCGLTALDLAAFRRRELLRILLRDLFGLAPLAEVTGELSHLADAIIHAAYRHIRRELGVRYGVPNCTTAAGEVRECGFSVIALGKLGGNELNYSSDIDLMFVYSGNGETSGPSRISNREFFGKVANSLTELLSSYTGRGVCYRVDLRLRPDGRGGEICLSLEGAKAYYASRARDWELQMLIKARAAAGEKEPGRELLEFTEPLTYSSTLDFSAVEAVSATRERIHEKVAAKRSLGDSGTDIKLTRGGIRDIEFLVQCLQRLHGGREPWVRHGGTLLALVRLNDKGLISAAEYSRLAGAYQFLRHLEHRLQVVEDRQTHVLPRQSAELEILARGMPAGQLGRAPSASKLLHRLNAHLEEVQETYDRVIHSQQPLYYSAPAAGPVEVQETSVLFEQPQTTNLVRFLDQRAPGVAHALQARPLRHGGGAFEALLEKLMEDPGQLRALEANAVLTADVLDIFEHSPWFADELVRLPSLLGAVKESRDAVQATASPESASAAELRRWFRQGMLRIQAGSICASEPIFDTLGRTSDVADAVIRRAVGLAIAQVVAARPGAGVPRQGDELMVIALGRLGMREFDVGSDADLIFVIPDEAAGEMAFWARVAERTIDTISAYTGEGVMFTVDTRLRPNGREGTLVQTVSACCDYLATRAEAWEGISWMKARCVAGDEGRATAFLHEIQQVDWRRYGQSGRSRNDLREMRARLEREQGPGNPLKAGAGGYYDIDFALMYLRLRSAGIFYRVLNTPERIQIVSETGHLTREDAEFLDYAATLFRAVDHGQRLMTGHSEGRLPQAPAQLARLTALVRRWVKLEDESLPDAVEQVRQRTRAYFRRVFG